jgi:hypothetical protein
MGIQGSQASEFNAAAFAYRLRPYRLRYGPHANFEPKECFQ